MAPATKTREKYVSEVQSTWNYSFGPLIHKEVSSREFIFCNKLRALNKNTISISLISLRAVPPLAVPSAAGKNLWVIDEKKHPEKKLSFVDSFREFFSFGKLKTYPVEISCPFRYVSNYYRAIGISFELRHQSIPFFYISTKYNLLIVRTKLNHSGQRETNYNISNETNNKIDL